MIIDIIALVLLVLALFKGISKGLIVAVLSLLAFIIGLAAALKLSAVVADYIGSSVNISHKWLPVLAFFLVFLIVALLIRLGAKMLEGIASAVMLGWLNRLGGVVFYILIYFMIYSILLFYATQLNLIKPETAQASVTYGFIQPMAPKVMDALGLVVPIFKNMFDRLLQFFQNVSDKKHPAQFSFLLIQSGKSIFT
jgi:membrane protein required for colicin V production